MCLSQEGGWITFSIFYNTFMVGYAVAQSMVFVDFFQVFGGNVKLGEIGCCWLNTIAGSEIRTHSYLRTRRASLVTIAIILTPHPNPFRDSLRSSQACTWDT